MCLFVCLFVCVCVLNGVPIIFNCREQDNQYNVVCMNEEVRRRQDCFLFLVFIIFCVFPTYAFLNFILTSMMSLPALSEIYGVGVRVTASAQALESGNTNLKNASETLHRFWSSLLLLCGNMVGNDNTSFKFTYLDMRLLLTH